MAALFNENSTQFIPHFVHEIHNEKTATSNQLQNFEILAIRIEKLMV